MSGGHETRSTLLARVRGLGSAHHGLQAWWSLRMTSLALIPLCVWFVISILSLSGRPLPELRLWLGRPLPATLMILTLAVGFHHMAGGIREILDDYVHTRTLRLVAIIFINGASVLLAGLAILSILKISLGA